MSWNLFGKLYNQYIGSGRQNWETAFREHGNKDGNYQFDRIS